MSEFGESLTEEQLQIRTQSPYGFFMHYPYLLTLVDETTRESYMRASAHRTFYLDEEILRSSQFVVGGVDGLCVDDPVSETRTNLVSHGMRFAFILGKPFVHPEDIYESSKLSLEENTVEQLIQKGFALLKEITVDQPLDVLECSYIAPEDVYFQLGLGLGMDVHRWAAVRDEVESVTDSAISFIGNLSLKSAWLQGKSRNLYRRIRRPD